MIERELTTELIENINSYPATGLIGPRQVGKTTLIKSISQVGNREVHHIDLENPRDRVQLDNPILFFERLEHKLIVLDEIQYRQDIIEILRPMIDQNRVPGRFVLLGSASPVLLRKSSESLAGRISYLELTPFLLSEIGMDNLEKLWFRGGFPESYLANTIGYQESWLRNFIRSYVEKDLPLFGLSSQPDVTLRLWQMIAHANGAILNYSQFSRSLGITSPTVKNYFSYFENAFLIRRLPSFHSNSKKRLVKAPKVYIRDTGLLHRLLELDNLEQLHQTTYLGNSWEAFVIEQILAKLPQSIKSFYYRSQNGNEVDLILTKGMKPISSIEIKYSAAPKLSRGFYEVIEELKTKNNFVITPNSSVFEINPNTQVCSLKWFLQNMANFIG